MVVLVPKICLDKGGTYNRRLCAQTVKEIYALRSELQYCLQKKEQIRIWIKRLDTWKNTKLNSPKWSKIVQLIEQSSKLQKARENILKDIELSGSLRYKDAMFILKDPEVQAEISKLLEYNKVKGISINALAALISKDGPKEIFKDTKEVIEDQTPLSTFEEPTTTKSNLNKYIKKQQPSFWGFFNPFNSSVRESTLISPKQQFGAFNLKKKLKSFKREQKWNVNDIVGEENIKNAEILKQFARREKLSREDVFNISGLPNPREVLGYKLEKLKQSDGSYTLPIDTIISKMSKISGEYDAYIQQNKIKLMDDLKNYIKKSKRTKVSVEDLVRKFERKLLDYFQFTPSNINERNKLSRRILDDLLRGDRELTTYREGNKTYWGLLEGNVIFEEKARKRIFKDTNQNALEKIFVESILSSFSKNGEQIKELNRIYNNEQSNLAVQLSNVKQEARALESSIEDQQEMFQELQKRNIQELPDTVVRSLDLWKRVLSPRTIAKIIEYSNDLSRYLVLLNELLHDDPNEYDLEMMSMIFSTRDEFDSAKYISETNKRLTTYVTKLKEYLDDWEIYQKQVESTLTYLFSDNVDNINFAMTTIKAILSSRPSSIFGVKKIKSEVSKQTELFAELVRKATEEMEKTNDPNKKIKLRKYIEDIREKYKDLKKLPDEKNAEVSYKQGLLAGQRSFREENPYDESAEFKPKKTGAPILGAQGFLSLVNDEVSPRRPTQDTRPPPAPQYKPSRQEQPQRRPQRWDTGVIVLPPEVDIDKFLELLDKNDNYAEKALKDLKAMEPDKAKILEPFLRPVGKMEIPPRMEPDEAVEIIKINILEKFPTRNDFIKFKILLDDNDGNVNNALEAMEPDEATRLEPFLIPPNKTKIPPGKISKDQVLQTLRDNINMYTQDGTQDGDDFIPTFAQVPSLPEIIELIDASTQTDQEISEYTGPQTPSIKLRRLDQIINDGNNSRPQTPDTNPQGRTPPRTPPRRRFGSNRRRSRKRNKKNRHSKKKNARTDRSGKAIRRSKKKVRIGAKCALGKKG